MGCGKNVEKEQVLFNSEDSKKLNPVFQIASTVFCVMEKIF